MTQSTSEQAGQVEQAEGSRSAAAGARADRSGREKLLEVVDLKTHFYTEEGELRAVDGVSFELGRGQTLALVGESGCGKSVTAYSILRLINPPGKIVGGSVRLHRGPGEEPLEILELREGSKALYEARGGRAAFIFQEATAALSPVHTIGNQIIEAILLHQKVTRRGARRLAIEMLDRVGIAEPGLCLSQYPHELSGGMRQRAVIAMALCTDPELLIADEPTTALDVTIQAQILALLKQLQKESGMAILLITHDLGVVSQMADEVLVMYLGRVVERGSVRAIMKKPRHPYSMGLLAAMPSLTPVGQRLPSVEGSVPALSDIPDGCPFHPRCAYAKPGQCNTGWPPPLTPLRVPSSRSDGVPEPEPPPGPPESEHSVACWRVREIALERLLQRPVPSPVPVAAREETPTPIDTATDGAESDESASASSAASESPAEAASEAELSAVAAASAAASPEAASATDIAPAAAAVAVARPLKVDRPVIPQPVEPFAILTPAQDAAEAAWFAEGERVSLVPEEELPE